MIKAERRDMFAAAALTGMLTQESDGFSWSIEGAAKRARALADAMIKELDSTGGERFMDRV